MMRTCLFVADAYVRYALLAHNFFSIDLYMLHACSRAMRSLRTINTLLFVGNAYVILFRECGKSPRP